VVAGCESWPEVSVVALFGCAGWLSAASVWLGWEPVPDVDVVSPQPAAKASARSMQNMISHDNGRFIKTPPW